MMEMIKKQTNCSRDLYLHLVLYYSLERSEVLCCFLVA